MSDDKTQQENNLGWHFTRGNKLRDGRPVPAIGEVLRHEGPIEIRRSGLHCSERLIDALRYAPGATLHQVRFGVDVLRESDKLVSRERVILRTLPRTETLLVLIEFAQWCAHRAATSSKEAAWAREAAREAAEAAVAAEAAREAAEAAVAAEAAEAEAAEAAWAAAWAAAAWAAEAARAATAWAATAWEAAARAAAEAARAAAARAAAWEAAAARAAEKETQNAKLTELVEAAFAKLEALK